jgi:hypothetical protein
MDLLTEGFSATFVGGAFDVAKAGDGIVITEG